MQTKRIVVINTRWDALQVGPRQIEVNIPTGPGGEQILNPGFVQAQKLTDAEIETAEYEVLKSIVVLKD